MKRISEIQRAHRTRQSLASVPDYPALSELLPLTFLSLRYSGFWFLQSLSRFSTCETNDLSEVVPLVGALLSIPTEDRYPPVNLTPQKRKKKTLAALVAQVERLEDVEFPATKFWAAQPSIGMRK